MTYLQRTTSAAPLVVFRIALGLLLFAGIIRFWTKGWIRELYIEPSHFFSFYGFDFVRPLGEYTYLLFLACAVFALMVAAGFLYRFAAAGLFLTFTYIELMDKSTYLNHYYFISMVCLLMIFLPAHVWFSVDAWRRPSLRVERIPRYTLDAIRVFVALLYVFAGLAKVNSDWLLEAQPLRIWLPAKNDLPLIGFMLDELWVAYAFSWAGCLYDLTIPFFLLNNSTRPFAYVAVIVFHVLTSILFPIGMFPYVMMATALIFFPADFHRRIAHFLAARIRVVIPAEQEAVYHYRKVAAGIIPTFLALFLLIQIALPFRYLLYPGELFWTEEGYRFSWRVMLMEKAGYAQFKVQDGEGKTVMVDNAQFLTPLQEKMMSTQPDMILQYAHMLRDHFSAAGMDSPRVFADAYVTVNGRLSRPFVDNGTDLARERDSFAPKPWILPFDNDIKGF